MALCLAREGALVGLLWYEALDSCLHKLETIGRTARMSRSSVLQ